MQFNYTILRNKNTDEKIVVDPPCQIAPRIFFKPDCSYSGHSSCMECLANDTECYYIVCLREMHTRFHGKA
jgi:hypothetical protein